MNCFQLVKSVLDEIYAKINLPDAEKDAVIEEKLNYLSGQYEKLAFDGKVDYADQITRFAYIYCYVTSHVNIIYKIFLSCPELRILMNTETVKMTSIGCGPGSDLLGVLKYLSGVLKYLSGLDQYPHITCRLYDREEAWRKSWQDIYEKIEQNLRITTIFQQFDVKTSSALNDPSEYLDSDFFYNELLYV